VAFEMIGDNYTDSLRQLDSVRARQAKFICINDNMQNPSDALEEVLQDFYQSFFPIPSQFELPPNRRNPTLYLDEYLRLHSQPAGGLVVALLDCFHKSLGFLIGIFKYTRSAAIRTLLSLLSRHVEDHKEGMDAEIYINGLRQDMRKPLTHINTPSSSYDPNHLAIFLSVVGLICLVALRTAMKRRPQGTGDESTPIVTMRSASPKKMSSPPSSSYGGPSSPIQEEIYVRKVAPKTPSKLERQLQQQLEREEQDDFDDRTSERTKGILPPPLSFGDDDDEGEGQSFFTALFGSGGNKDMNRADGNSHATHHSRQDTGGDWESQQQQPSEEEEVVESGVTSSLPPAGAIPARSGFRKGSSGTGRKGVHWDKSVQSPPSSSGSSIANALRNAPDGARAALHKIFGSFS